VRPFKIATLHGEKNGSFLVRCQTPLLWLKEQRAIEVLPQEKAWEADLVFLHGIHTWPGALSLVRSLKRNGIRVVADMDVDVLSKSSKTIELPVREFLGAVDAITVPTEPLAASLATLNTRVLVNSNGLNLKLWRPADKFGVRNQARTVGFAGSVSHLADLDLLRPALAKLANEFKVQGIRFVCFGFRPAWLSQTLADTEVVEFCSPQDYPALLNKLRIDVALAPLVTCDFNRSRSALKFYEYSAAGAVTVASNFGPFAEAIQDGSTGLLVDNQPDSWARAIGKLLRKEGPRLQLREAARVSLEAHDVSKTAPRLLEAFEAVQPNRDREFFAFPRTNQTNDERPDVDVVIPIGNAASLTREAIEDLLPELNAKHQLILVDDRGDDTSTEAANISLLAEYSGRPWLTVHRNPRHRGFHATCNLAVANFIRPSADVILMDPETRPMPGFIRRLAQTAGSNPEIGTVTAVSNNGSLASVPNLPDAEELATRLPSLVVIAPVAASHLVYIKRQIIRKYGLFDEAFSSNTAAEIDFSMRLSGEYANVIDTGCWCQRAGFPPFSETVRLHAEDQALIDKRYPHARFEVEGYYAADPLMEHRRKMVAATRDLRPRVLQVAHTFIGGGGTEKHILDLEGAVSSEFLSFGAAPHEVLALHCGHVPLGKYPYEKAGWPLATSDLPANDQSWINVLNQVKPDLIHFHHLLNHPLSLLAKLTSTGIPVIVSIHDYYFFCPDFHLLNCPGVHSCETCFPERFKGPAQYQALRRDLLGGSLRTAAALIAPSLSTANLVREVYPDLKIGVIPHGIREPEGIGQAVTKLRANGTPGANRKLRFGMIGNVLPVKGIEVIFKVWPLVARDEAAELHIWGTSDPVYVQRCQELGIHYHGPYQETDLPGILSEIDVGIMPAQVQETFSYTLSEFFAGGVPVIGSDYGALGDRIENAVNGLKVPPRDIQAWADAIRLTISDTAFRERITAGVRRPDSISDMARHYAELYRDVIQRSKTSKPPVSIDVAACDDRIAGVAN
jgi:glycosyltransferase involved in cell wall biosynthesis